MPVEITLGGHGGRVVVTVLGYENPSATSPSDANWLNCEILVRIGGWEGGVRAALTTEDFATFSKELRAVLDGTEVYAALDTMEEALSFKVEMTRTGHCRLSGTVRDRSNVDVKFSFVLQSDQTFLRPALARIEQVERAFPVHRQRAP